MQLGPLQFNPLSVVGAGVGLYAAGSLISPKYGDKGRRRNLKDTYDNNSLGAAGLAGFGGYLIGSKSFSNQLTAQKARVTGFFGAAFTYGTLSDIRKGDNVAVAITANSLAGAAGIIAFSYGRKYTNPGLSLLSTYMEEAGQGNTVKSVARKFDEIASKFPQLKGLLGPETLGLALAAGTIPIAHSLIQRSLAVFHRSQRNFADAAAINEFHYNQAGDYSEQKEMSGEYKGGSSEMPVTMDMKTVFSSQNIRLLAHAL